MDNIEKCKAAQAQGLRVQLCVCSGVWDTLVGTPTFNADSEDYRIHPDDEAKFVEPGATPARETHNTSTKVVNGRTYTHRLGEYLCRVVCTDYFAAPADAVVVGLDPEDGREFVGVVTLKKLTPGTDPAFDVDWAKVAIDAPIWVRDSDTQVWTPRHFAGLAQTGQVRAFESGATSHSANPKAAVLAWKQARLTKPE